MMRTPEQAQEKARKPRKAKRAAVAARPSLHSADLVTRAGAARLLGCSVSHVRKLETRGELAIALVDEGGVHYYARAEVARLSVARTVSGKQGTPRTAAGEVAALAFGLLEAGDGPIDLVRKLRLAPELVEQLEAKWRQFRAAKDKSGAPSSEDAPLCAGCHEANARFCAGCARTLGGGKLTPPAAPSSSA